MKVETTEGADSVPSALDSEVWIIRKDKVECSSFRELIDYRKEVPLSDGVGPAYYIKQFPDSEGQWPLFHYRYGKESKVGTYPSEAEALRAVESIWILEILESTEIDIYDSEASAQESLKERT